MGRLHQRNIVLRILSMCGALQLVAVTVAGPPEAPPVSSYAPADDLIAELSDYVEAMEETISDESEFANDARRARLDKDAHTASVVALALAMHDAPHDLKHAAAEILASCQAISSASQSEDHGQAKNALAKLKNAAVGEASGTSHVTWLKVAPMNKLMKQVEFVDNRLKLALDPRRLKRSPETSRGYAVVLAVIAQEVMYDVPEGTEGANLAAWYRYCEDMRDAAGALNRAIRSGDFDAVPGTAKRLTQSCNDCHVVFRRQLVAPGTATQTGPAGHRSPVVPVIPR